MDDITIASGLDGILRLRPQWDEAAARAAGAGAFLQFEMIWGAAQLAEARGAEPLVAVLTRDGRVCSLLPLRLERAFGARVLLPLADPLAQYTDVLGEAFTADDLDRLCALMRDKGADLLLFRKVREDSGLYAALSRRGHSQRALQVAHYIDLAAYPTFAAYEASFSNRTRRTRRQRVQRLEAQVGPLSFDVLQGEAAVAAFDTALAWKRQWLAARGLSSPVVDCGDWEPILRQMAAQDKAIVTTLNAGPDPIAVEIGLRDRATYIAYLGAFDATLSPFSPGQEQMLRTIAWCFERGFERYDLLAPQDDYKRHWSRTGTGVSLDDYSIALTPLGRGIAEVRRHVRPIARDLYYRLSPEMRVAGGRYSVPAATVAAAAAAASAVMVVIE